ncbi:MAG: DsbA family protein [Rhodospirillaceae bacterium]
MTLSVDVFWSFRSPYCYLTLDRFAAWAKDYDLEVVIRAVYPMAVRDPSFFANVNRKYRKYHTNDYHRVAEMLGMAVRRPVPDPIVMDNEKYEIAADQPHISKITRIGAAAQEAGKSFEFTNRMSRTLWDGKTDDWNTDAHFTAALTGAGLDAAAVLDRVENKPDELEAIIAENQRAFDAADHWGAPCMVFDGETFYGQDRLDVLLWRMKQKGLSARA